MRGRQARALGAELERALALHRQQQLDAAARLYRKILQAAPGHADALQLLGAIEGQQGRLDSALALLRRAVAADPGNAAALHNLGNTLASMERHAEALAAFEQALQLKPDNPKALRNQGNTLRRLKRLPEALACLDRALALQPDYAEALVSRAELLQEMQRPQDAVQSFRAALASGKDAELIRFALASLGAEPAPERAPAGYVKGLFDQYAGQFDEHLVGTLNYRTPALLAEALQALDPPARGEVVDLGCGTGLCGALLRPLATRLVGVDLSPGMLERARDSGHYDELACADLCEWLAGAGPRFDLAVASDVLIYLGALDAVFAGVAGALRPGGRFALSVESAPGAGYVLHANRRYAHSQPYLEALAAAHGLAVVSIRAAVLREDGGRPVEGLIVVLARGAG